MKKAATSSTADVPKKSVSAIKAAPASHLLSEAQMRAITRKVIKADPAFKRVVAESELCTIGRFKPKHGHFETLAESIISQQLSIKAADTIYKRIKSIAGGELTPERLVPLTTEQLRECGASNAKARTLHALAAAALAGELSFRKYSRMSNEQITAELVAIWGIGPWTVQMFLMFHLGRLDLWPTGDLGVRKGWDLLHPGELAVSEKSLQPYGEKFAGYTSVVAWYCWRALSLD
jgi:DNA-3-methyladenine glycosylase II